jgi:tagatose 6-phosphate kinase
LEGRKDALEAARKVQGLVGAGAVVVTLGADGLVASTESGDLQADAPKVEVADVAGAGDTAVAAIALARALGPLDGCALELAAQASARVVRHVGVAVPSADDLAEIRSL